MSEFETDLSIVICDSVVSLPLFVTYDYHPGHPVQTIEHGEPPSSPAEPERVEITAAWTCLPMEPRPAGSNHKPAFRYSLLPLMSEEQVEELAGKILEEHE